MAWDNIRAGGANARSCDISGARGSADRLNTQNNGFRGSDRHSGFWETQNRSRSAAGVHGAGRNSWKKEKSRPRFQKMRNSTAIVLRVFADCSFPRSDAEDADASDCHGDIIPSPGPARLIFKPHQTSSFSGLAQDPFFSLALADPSFIAPSAECNRAALLRDLGGALAEALEVVHHQLTAHAESAHLRPDRVERTKLMVRLGHVCYGPTFGNSAEAMQSHPPFTLQQLQNQLSNTERTMAVHFYRQFDTVLHPAAFEGLESELMDQAVFRRKRATVKVVLTDTWGEDLVYKLVCTEEDGALRLQKVKGSAMRYGVLDITRPHHTCNFRVLLITDTHHTSLPAELEATFRRILAEGTLDPSQDGAVVWPGALNTGGAMFGGRFKVKHVRRTESTSVDVEGLHFKVKKVNGRDVDQGNKGNRRTEVEIFPASWRSIHKEHSPRLNDAGVWDVPRNVEVDWQPGEVLETLPHVLKRLESIL